MIRLERIFFNFLKLVTRSLGILFFSFLVFYQGDFYAQSGLCDPSTPFYSVDLTGDPSEQWVSDPRVSRSGLCCGSSWPDRCIEFEVRLHAGATAILFEIVEGAIPQGAMYYQSSCNPPVAVGEPMCLEGPGPHVITFCKPGSNKNIYGIRSLPGPGVSDDDTTRQACRIRLGSEGLDPSSIVWNSVYPGDRGDYNSLLDCTTGCDSVTFSPFGAPPEYIDYEVCGTPLVGSCYPGASYCDTIRVHILDPLFMSVNPNPAVYCATESGINVASIVNGGDPPYTYSWISPNETVIGTNSSVFVSDIGTYRLEVEDQLSYKCPSVFENFEVEKVYPGVVDAGPDQELCLEPDGAIQIELVGEATNTENIRWSSNGAGVFDAPTMLSSQYTPSEAEFLDGSFKLYLTDYGSGGCPPVIDSLTITLNPILKVTVSAPSVACFGEEVLVSLNVDGSGDYTYNWDMDQLFGNPVSVYSGRYGVTVIDNVSGCDKQVTFDIPENPELGISVPAPSITCDASASVEVFASGGSPSYTYKWNNGLEGSSQSLGTGDYTVTVVDRNNCTVSDVVSVTALNSALFTEILGTPDTVCFQDSATLTTAVSGAFGSVSYSWDTGLLGDTLSLLKAPAGDYCVTVTDAAGCMYTSCNTINEHTPLNAVITVPEKACFGGTRDFQVDVSGGTPPYSHLWNTGETTSSNTQKAGTYDVTTTDINACVAEASVTFEEADEINIDLLGDSISCYGGNDGKITSFVSGGEAPYKYRWDNGESRMENEDLQADVTHHLEVTDNIECIAEASKTLYQPTPLNISVIETNPTSCFDGADGSAEVTTTGGVPPYTYNWINENGVTLTQYDAFADNLSAGRYTVQVTDAKSCAPAVTYVNVSQPSKIKEIDDEIVDPTCGLNNGEIRITVEGGSPGYSYSWSPYGGNTPKASNLAPGKYTLTVTDDNNCSFVSESWVYDIPTPVIDSIVSTDLTCNNASDGGFIVYASSYYGNETYSIDDGNTFSADSNYEQLSAGKYIVTVKDENSCIIKDSIEIVEPDSIKYDVLTEASQCLLPNGSAWITGITGGNGSYTIEWENNSVNDTVSGLGEGIYSVIVRDSSNCFSEKSFSIPNTEGFEGSVAWTNPTCFGYSDAAAIAVGGDPLESYEYQWDINANNQVTDTIKNLVAGEYKVVIKELSSGCTSTKLASIEDPEKLVLNTSSGNPSICPGNEITLAVNASGGVGSTYIYSWNNNLGDSSDHVISPDTSTTYTVFVSDTNGCVSDTTVISVSVHSIPQIEVSPNQKICIGDSADINVTVTSGTTSPYEFLWTNGIDANEQTVTPLITTNYKVQVRDFCSNIIEDSVTVIVNPLPDVDFEAVNFKGCAPVLSVDFFNRTDDSNEMVGSVLWNFGNGEQNTTGYTGVNDVIYEEPGTYSVSLTVTSTPEAGSCTNSLVKENYIEVFDLPVASFSMSDNMIKFPNLMVNFMDKSYDNIEEWYWDFASISSATRQHPRYTFPDSTGRYIVELEVTDSNGCKDKTNNYVQVEGSFALTIPNAFTPGDGNNINDGFTPYGYGISENNYFFQIYDRWGELIFETDKLFEPWDGYHDGKIAPIDVYVWKLTYKPIEEVQVRRRTGMVTVVR